MHIILVGLAGSRQMAMCCNFHDGMYIVHLHRPISGVKPMIHHYGRSDKMKCTTFLQYHQSAVIQPYLLLFSLKIFTLLSTLGLSSWFFIIIPLGFLLLFIHCSTCAFFLSSKPIFKILKCEKYFFKNVLPSFPFLFQ